MAFDARPGTANSQGSPGAAQNPSEERDLVAAVLRHDRKATARFVGEYTDAVYAYVRHRLAPRADLVDDVVQEVFLAALNGLPGFQGTAPLRVWLLGIARHKVEAYYRQRLRAPDGLADHDVELVDDGGIIDERIDRERLEQKTRSIMRRMPELYGIVLLWRYWENRSVRDIAEASGRTEKAVERLLARARGRFRDLWREVSP